MYLSKRTMTVISSEAQVFPFPCLLCALSPQRTLSLSSLSLLPVRTRADTSYCAAVRVPLASIY